MLDSAMILFVCMTLAVLLAVTLRAKIGRHLHRRPLARFVCNEWLPTDAECDRIEEQYYNGVS